MKKCAIHLVALILTSAAALAAETNAPPTATELLDKFAKAQDQIMSFIAKGEETMTGARP